MDTGFLLHTVPDMDPRNQGPQQEQEHSIGLAAEFPYLIRWADLAVVPPVAQDECDDHADSSHGKAGCRWNI